VSIPTADISGITVDNTGVTVDGTVSAAQAAGAFLLADLDHWFGEDLVSTNIGDIQTVTGTTRGEQRVMRRLLTNPGDDIFDLTYGAGLLRYIGSPANIPKMQALCVAQMKLESVVAPSPQPTCVITQSPSDLSSFQVLANYTDQPTGIPVTLAFTMSP
jgi:hypothetical protein